MSHAHIGSNNRSDAVRKMNSFFFFFVIHNRCKIKYKIYAGIKATTVGKDHLHERKCVLSEKFFFLNLS